MCYNCYEWSEWNKYTFTTLKYRALMVNLKWSDSSRTLYLLQEPLLAISKDSQRSRHSRFPAGWLYVWLSSAPEPGWLCGPGRHPSLHHQWRWAWPSGPLPMSYWSGQSIEGTTCKRKRKLKVNSKRCIEVAWICGYPFCVRGEIVKSGLQLFPTSFQLLLHVTICSDLIHLDRGIEKNPPQSKLHSKN